MKLHSFLMSMTISGVKNISSPVTISFIKSKNLKRFDPTHDRVRAIYGPNGSGKTAITTGIWLVRALLLTPGFLFSLGEEYFANVLNKDHPAFSFSADFCLVSEKKADEPGVNAVYRYSIEIDGSDISDVHIVQESLGCLKGRYGKEPTFLPVFKTYDGKLTMFEGGHGKIKEEAQNIVRKESLLPLLLNHYQRNEVKVPDNIAALIRFASQLIVITNHEDDHSAYFQISKKRFNELLSMPEGQIKDMLRRSGSPASQSTYLIKKKDIGNFEKYLARKTKFIRLFKPDLKKIEYRKVEAKDYFECTEVLDYGSYSVSFDFESAGIQKLMGLYSALDAAINGKIVFIDEIDTSISGPYLQKLVEFMNEYGQGQLCFTAHNLEPMKVLSDHSGSIYFLGVNGEVTSWKKNANYKPYILYPEGMVKGIDFDIDSFDFIAAFQSGER